VCALVSTEVKVNKWARSHAIPVYQSGNELLDKLQTPIDYLFSIVNDHILRDDILTKPQRAAINYHDGPLPRYAGTHATSWALMNHERVHGITWHLVTDIVDAGDILKQAEIEIDANETAHSLNTKCYDTATRTFGELIAELSKGAVVPKKQNLLDRTFFPRYKRPPNGGVINWSSSARDISALIRALDFGPHPNPLGVSKVAIDDTYVLVSHAELSDSEAASLPGTINEIGDDFLRVSCIDKEVVLRRFHTLEGQPLLVSDLVENFDLRPGFEFSSLDIERYSRIEQCVAETSRSESYWVNKLLTLEPAVPPLADGNSTAATAPFEGISFSLPIEFSDLIGRSTRSAGLHVIAGFGAFLSRLIDNESFDVGFADADGAKQFGDISGLFPKRLAFRFEVDWQQGFSKLLESTDAELEAVRKHKTFVRDISVRYPGVESLVGSAGLDAYPANVVLTTNELGEQCDIGGDLTLIVDKNSPNCRFVYDAKKFVENDVKRLLGYFTTLLKEIARDTDRSLGYLSLLTEKEKDLLLSGVNDDRIDVPTDKCIHHLFEAQVERTPNATALVVGVQRLSYSELNLRAERVARRLRMLGVGPDVLVAICVERSCEMIAGILGILKAGGAYVPLDPAYPKPRLDQILSDSNAAVLVTQSSVLNKLGDHDAAIVLIDSDHETVEQIQKTKQVSLVQPDNLAYVIYTSGSTGRPKGVAIEHRSTVSFLTWATSVFNAEKLKGTVASTSICFDLSIFEIFAPLSCGGTVILVENILHLPSAPAAAEATLINTVPSAITELLKTNGIPESVCTVNLAGEPLKPSLVKQIYQTRNIREVFDLYGPTEDTTYSTFTLRNESKASIGRPISNTQAYVLDRNLQPVPPGVPGELYLGGDGLARGYLNQPDLTAGRFIKNPFNPDPTARLYRTGDLVRYLPSFEIEYLGRVDNQVKIRGFRIELGEIETVLSSHPAVAEAVVTARSDQRGDKRLIAYIVNDGRERIGTSALRDHVKNVLPDFMVPSVFVELDELPLTPNGKIDRKALPEPSISLVEVNRTYIPSQNQVELALVRIWERLLNVSPIGIRDNFFELGGDSLISVSLFVEIENEFGIELPLSSLINSPTIEKLAAELDAGGADASTKYLVPLQTEGDRPPLFCMHAAGGNVLFYRDLASELGDDQPFYGLQARGVADKSETAHDRVEDMAADYISEIRCLQPKGPYHLCGASFGGLVAFEAARQLVALGEEVGTLALFDTYAPGYAIPNQEKSRSHHLKSLARRATRIGNQLRELERWGARAEFIRSKAAKIGIMVARKVAWKTNQFAIEYNKATGRKLPVNMMRNHDAIQSAMDSYMPGTFDGNMLLFRASEQPVANFDEYLGWDSLVNGNIKAVVVKGTHGALTVYPYASDLASKYKPFLEESEATLPVSQAQVMPKPRGTLHATAGAMSITK
jgi:amino acid adenylation domain-containing protein